MSQTRLPNSRSTKRKGTTQSGTAPALAMQQHPKTRNVAREELIGSVLAVARSTAPDCVPGTCTRLLCRRTQTCQLWRSNVAGYFDGRPDTATVKALQSALIGIVRQLTMTARQEHLARAIAAAKEE